MNTIKMQKFQVFWIVHEISQKFVWRQNIFWPHPHPTWAIGWVYYFAESDQRKNIF